MDISHIDRLALSQFSSEEKQSIYQMLCGMMIIDKVPDPREKRIIEEVVDIIGLTQSERQASRAMNTQRQLNVLKSMDTLKKCYLAKFLAQVALADGVVTREENVFFNYYTQMLGLPADPENL